jgi:hypothetical protein
MNYKGFEVEVTVQNYQNGGKAILLVDKFDHTPVAVATSFIGELDTDEVAVKDYSENEGMYEWLLEHDIVRETNKIVKGFPIAKLNKL